MHTPIMTKFLSADQSHICQSTNKRYRTRNKDFYYSSEAMAGLSTYQTRCPQTHFIKDPNPIIIFREQNLSMNQPQLTKLALFKILVTLIKSGVMMLIQLSVLPSRCSLIQKCQDKVASQCRLHNRLVWIS
jgi:hypothetical protein